MGRDDKVVLLDEEIGYLHVRKIQREGLPAVAIIPRDVDPVLRSGVEQTAALRIFANGMDEIVAANAADDLRPRLAEVVGAIDVGRAVVVLVILGREIRRTWIVRRRVDEADAGEFRQAGRGDVRPALAAVARDVREAVDRKSVV